MKRCLPIAGVATLLMGMGVVAQAQNPVANLEPTNPSNYNVSIVDPVNNPVAPVPGLALDSNTKVTWLSGDPVRVVFPGRCYVQLPTFQGVTPAATPCCPGTLTQLTTVTVDANACALPAAVPLAGGGLPVAGTAGAGWAGVVPILAGAALVGGILAINADNNASAAEPVSPSAF